MRYAIKRLSLAMTLILLASSALLISDIMRRRRRPGDLPSVAALQFASTSVMEEGMRGFKDSLKENGFVDGRNIRLKLFNAEGDIATANSIAREMTNGRYDFLVTFSTPCLQAVYGSNRTSRIPHLFGLVADPSQSGVGVNPNDMSQHPAHLTGLATLLPVEECFETMLQMNPNLKTVGVAWNASEMNSEIYVKRARIVAKRLGIELQEANVENSSAVLQAVQSLLGRGVQCLWVGGDSTVSANIQTVISLAQQSRIPVITVTPAKPERGTLLDYGVSFYEAGAATGDLTARALRGESLAKIPIEDVKAYAARVIVVNRNALHGLRETWNLPPDLVNRATILVDESGIHRRKNPKRKTATKPAPKAP